MSGLGIVIEPLASHHDRSAFSCGEPELDDWFRRRASQDERRNVARVFVAMDGSLGIVGFYSLGAYTLALTDLPEALARKLPRYGAIPAALIGRLARDVRSATADWASSFWPMRCAASLERRVPWPCSLLSSMPRTIARWTSTGASASGASPPALVVSSCLPR